MRFYTTFLFTFILPLLTFSQESFSFQKVEITPGSKKHFQIPITDGKDSTFIPVTVFHGTKKGPVLGITAGIHGYEYPPILAAQKLNHQIDPQNLRGTVILVQIANVAAFLGRSPFLNPMDGKNLNRSFPGKADGSITERVAHTITEEVIARSDFFVDMHSGDAPEDLRPYNAWYQSDALPEVSKKGKEMALAMGYDYAIIFNIPKERLEQPSIYCSQEAFHQSIPAVDIECGRLGIPGKTETDIIVKSMLALLAHLEMTSAIPETQKEPTIIAKRSSVKSESTGFWHTDKKAGDKIKMGDTVGHITDFFGNTFETIVSPQDGMILYMIGTPPINKGETIMNIGILP
ncbi:MAG: succinylglutamate desuccinylase/aspartoacylase family protein [Flavobacteriaceae bacterium]